MTTPNTWRPDGASDHPGWEVIAALLRAKASRTADMSTAPAEQEAVQAVNDLLASMSESLDVLRRLPDNRPECSGDPAREGRSAEGDAIPAGFCSPGGKASCLHLRQRERCNDCPLADEQIDQADDRVKRLAARLIGYVQARPDYNSYLLLAHVNETLSTFAYNEILNHRKAIVNDDDDRPATCNHWPGQKRCGVCGMGSELLGMLADATRRLEDSNDVLVCLIDAEAQVERLRRKLEEIHDITQDTTPRIECWEKIQNIEAAAASALAPVPSPDGAGLPPINEALHTPDIIASLQQRALFPPTGAAEPDAVRSALEPRFQALRSRLLHAITMASNDDGSEPMSEKRGRHVERISTMYVAIDFIDSAPAVGVTREAIAQKLDEVAEIKSGVYLSSVCRSAMAEAILAMFSPVPDATVSAEPAAWRSDDVADATADIWRAYCAETSEKERSPQGALAFGVAFALSPQDVGREATVEGEYHKLDNDRQVFFYEQDFYVLSNFSAFSLAWEGIRFDTSEAAYHYTKFIPFDDTVQHNNVRGLIRHAPSAHEAFKIAERNKALRRADWDDVKVVVMRDILRAKAEQHEYVRRKLLATGDRELIEDSWRDDFWGWGPNRDGQNMLGKLWMEVRDELRSLAANGGGR